MITRLLILIFLCAITACGSIQKSIRSGDVGTVRSELNGGQSVNRYVEGEYGPTSLLGIAAEANQTAMIELLLSLGADIERGQEYNAKRTTVTTPLMMAASNGRIEAVQLLLARGANVHNANKDGTTALHFASSRASIYGSASTVRILLEHGANLLGVNKSGKNAAHFASDVVEGKELTILIKEARSQDKHIAETTGEKRPLITWQLTNAKSNSGYTPLYYSATNVQQWNGLQTAEMLLRAGSNPNIPDNGGWTPLHAAADKDNTRMMTLLLKWGANPNAKTKHGDTARTIHNKSPYRSSGFDFGKVIAIAGGAALASSSGMDSMQQAEFMTNYTADVLTDSGGTNIRNWGNNGGSSSSDINDPLNPNNPINKKMSAQVKRNVGLHEQKQQQAKQEYEVKLQQHNQQRAASLRQSGFQHSSAQQITSVQNSQSQQSYGSTASTPVAEKSKSKYSGISFAAKEDETEVETEKEKVEAPPVALSKGEMFGDSEEYYYSKKSSMNIAQTHLQNNTAEYCGSSLKSKLTWHDHSTTCKELNEQFRCKVYATATCFDKSCDTFFCGTKR